MSLSGDKSFLKSGHLPTLFAAFLYFDASFMCWVLLGPLGIQISKALSLDPAHKGLMVAVPVLAGAVIRILNGVLVDHFGAKRTGIGAQLVVILGLAAAWFFGVPSYDAVLLLGVVLGIAGASFAIALPMASRWYPPQHQGKALGLAGAGNSGTVLAALFAPALGLYFGWVNVFGLTALAMCVVLAVFIVLAKEAPIQPPKQSLSGYLKVLAIADTWWFMLFYAVTFGGFVGLASSLSIYFHAQYGLEPVQAGYATAACVFTGSMFRPIGGWLADKVGGIRALSVLYVLAAAMLVLVSVGLPSLWMALGAFVVAMLALGTGNGAVFQLVPVRFGREIGVMTGLVGFAGGLGGFYLASSLGFSKQWTGSYQAGFLIFAGLALVAFIGINIVKKSWRASFSKGVTDMDKVRI
ncbi:MAG TPA: nitrate/nitrite transporter [Acidocella sp.]|uniref:nitrate/nitrite transporter n=1 Tax=Acidiphilium sp. 20-67-58 TaxID=1970291 RepID=UPI000BD45575|nr:nitrate/nitrite transporter [Acidiphilium sp. 20-67-58]OYV54676.1 MAG: MFS transporter [Acidiphilium sp. 20-67-58]OYV57855.1 MAG: MFS transporter [Acidocella sp. 21-58-7]HQT65670.1 nitrate/nitrite transporter [Acidocella sp.]HQU05467.1 nitrate/nitrite transporter [Acidocella sp.]